MMTIFIYWLNNSFNVPFQWRKTWDILSEAKKKKMKTSLSKAFFNYSTPAPVHSLYFTLTAERNLLKLITDQEKTQTDSFPPLFKI